MQTRDKDVALRAKPSKRYSPMTDGQRDYWKGMTDCELVLCDGPAGTGKTVLACQMGADLFRSRKISRIILTRPLVTVGQSPGILPGSLSDKVAPFLTHLRGYFSELMPTQRIEPMADPEEDIDISQPGIYFIPIEYTRGLTFDNAFVFVDEAENCTREQLKLITGRMGKGSRLVMSGDSCQNDIPNPFWLSMLDLFEDAGRKNWCVMEMDESDIVRSGLCRETEKVWGEAGK